MPIKRYIPALAVSALFLAGCQTTGQNKWVTANPQIASSQSAEAPSTLVAQGITRDEIFEVGRNPYAYQNIPPNSRPATDTTEAGLWYVVDKVEEKSKTAGNLIRDDALQIYIDGIVCKLAGPYCGDVRVYVQNIPAFNASMAPNGMMSVWSGFLLRAQNEAQLASVLGHEIGHYIRRHTIQGMEDAVAKSNFGMVFQLAAATMGVPVAGNVAQLMLIGSLHSFSRDNEREADLIGVSLLAKHGYDTREAAKIWQHLIEEIDPDGEKTGTTNFLSTHPSGKERQETLSSLANELQGPGKWGKTYKRRFDANVGPWKHQFIMDELRLEKWDNMLRLVKILESSGVAEDKIAFYRGEVFRRRGNEGDPDAEELDGRRDDIDRAFDHYRKAADMNTQIPEAYRSLGLMYEAKDMPSKAKQAYLKYLELMPDAKDAKMIKYMIDSMGAPVS